MGAVTAAYTRRRPEETTLYAVVRDNLATLYGAVEDGALPISLPAFVRKELDGYLECGMLCRGFARLRCDGCEETRIVAFSCKGRGFCPSCLGRKMAQTAAHLVEDVLPPVALRQWVLTFPYAWRKRLGYDAALLSALTGIFLKTVLGFYRKKSGGAQAGGKSGAVVSVQRTSSDLKLNPHLHAVFLDGAYKEDVAPPSTSSSEDALDAVPRFLGLGHLQTREVAEVLERAITRMLRYCKRRKLLAHDRDEAEADHADAQSEETRGHAELVASAVPCATPPAGPSFPVRSPGLLAHPGARVGSRNTDFERPLCVGRDGFTLHAATRAGGADLAGREALLKYILRPAVAQERIMPGKDGLVRITLKRAFSDGTVAIDMDPLSLLSRHAAAVPYSRFHTVRYSGVLASASKLRPKNAPKPEPVATEGEDGCVHPALACEMPAEVPKRGPYRPWAELLKRTFGFDVLQCVKCQGRMRLLAVLTQDREVRRYLRGIGEATDLPTQAPARSPPYWQSRALRRRELGDEAA
jgi:Putative transposase/Transposase zinc-binding domain